MTIALLLLAAALGIAAITPRGVSRRERARDAKGRFVPDDPATLRNEAWK